MRKLLLTVILLLASPYLAWSATYYVAQSAAGSGDGTSYADRMSVSSHNSGSFSGDDIIYLCDTITSRVLPPSSGTSGHYITYKGDYAGHTAELTYYSSGVDTFRINAKNYIIVDSITIHDGSYGISIASGSTYVTVKKCTIYNMDMKGVNVDNSSYVTVGGASGDGNDIYDIGNSTAGTDVIIDGAHDVTVSYNKLYATGTTYGIDGIALTAGCYSIIMEYNSIYSHNHSGGQSGEDGIDIKQNNNNIIVRYNHIYDHQYQSGITVQMGSYNVQIYGNSIHDNAWAGVYIKRGSEGSHDMYDIDVWGNIIYSNSSGVMVADSGSGGPTNLDDVGIYNNVLAENGNKSAYQWAGVDIEEGASHIVKNNIFYKNTGKPGGNTYEQVHLDSSASATFDSNYYYYPGVSGQDMFTYESTLNTLTEWNAQAFVGTSFEGDPGMTDPNNNDYTLQITSPCFDSGINLGASFDDALDPNNTTFSDVPPTVTMVDQDSYGTGWEIGAYAIVGVSNVSPADGATGVTVDASATWSSPYANDDVWLTIAPSGCAGLTACDGTPDSDNDADNTFDMTTIIGGATETAFCLEFKADGGAKPCQQFDFTTAAGPPADPSVFGSVVQDDSAGDGLQSDSAGDILTQ